MGFAEEFKTGKKKFNKIYSIEALQHFDSIPNFITQANEKLADNGVLVVSTFMFKSYPSENFLVQFPNFECGVDKVIVFSELIQELKKEGFSKIKSISIGKNVWDGFNAWIMQTEFADTWNTNWKKAYDTGLLDYYILVCKKK